MSILRLAFVVLFTLVGALAGCSQSHRPPGGAEFTEVCLQTDTHCSRLYACATPSRLSLEQMLFAHDDEASCVVAMGAFFGAYCAQVGTSLDSGRASVDLTRLTACWEFLRGLSCEQYLSADPSTQPLCVGTPFVSGRVASGGACADDLECATVGELCSSEGTTLGTCGPGPGEGDACIREEVCAGGLHCDDGICMAGCSRDLDCPGEWCDRVGNDFRPDVYNLIGVCAPLRALGEECESAYSCEPGLYCDDTNPPGLDGWREPGNCAVPHGAGEPCSQTADCVSRMCADGICE